MLPLETVYEVARCFQALFMGLEEAPSCWKIVKLVFLRKPDAELPTWDKKLSKWYASSIIFRLERENQGEWKKQHVGGVDEISWEAGGQTCDLQAWQCQKEDIQAWQCQKPYDVCGQHGPQDSLRRGAAKAHCAAKTQGWIIAALSREMYSLKGKAQFECAESECLFTRYIRQGSVKAPTLWLKLARHILALVEKRSKERSMEVLIEKDGHEDKVKYTVCCGLTIIGLSRIRCCTWNR